GDTDSAAVNGGDGGGPEFEIDRIGTVGTNHLHAQARWNLCVSLVAAEVLEPVVDIVHAHHGGGRPCGVHRFGRKILLRLRENGGSEPRGAGRDGGGHRGSPRLLR